MTARRGLALLLLGVATLTGCEATLPSARINQGVRLPVPAQAEAVPDPARLSAVPSGEKFRLSARTLIPIAFKLQPDIKSSFQRFQSEGGRYDFFYTSRDSLTPKFRTSGAVGETRATASTTRHRRQSAEISLEKRFFDTTRMDISLGLERDALNNDEERTQPVASASIRYPLWVSREKLERTSEDIFRRNELNDAQLGYIQEVRSRLQDALFSYYRVVELATRVEIIGLWRSDLEELTRTLDGIQGRDLASDRSRVAAELARVRSEERNLIGRYEIDFERMKSACGIPFNAEVEVFEEPFNPFEGASHQELLEASIETDPEIATLQNEVLNAEVQLDLARRGTWDLALLFDAQSNLEGSGDRQGNSDWSVRVGLDVSAVDPRVTNSLIRQARARIARFKQAIAARENSIFVDTLEPIVRIETLSESRDELRANLKRFEKDYRNGIVQYHDADLNIDDLLKRRETLFEQRDEINDLTATIGFNVAELCSATGRFFELIAGEGSDDSGVAEPVP